MRFAIVIHKDPGSCYGVAVPGLPGCFSAGDTLDEAVESAPEAIACHLEGMLMDGKPIPEQPSLAELQAREECDNAVWALVNVDLSKLASTTKRVNITMPARVLALVDQAAVREGETRSGYLARAALSHLGDRTADDSTSIPPPVPPSEPREEGAEEGYGVEDEQLDGDAPEVIQPFDPTRISISTKTPTVDLVMKRLKHDEIDLNPDFQRNPRIWDNTRQSRLIESLLLRIPLPVFYMAADRDNKWQVVDGLQRLDSIKSFVLDKTLKFRGMEYLSRFENNAYDDLPRDMQRRIGETQLAFHVIDAGTPPEVMFNVFKRLNTGGKPLTSQEIRHALNPGPARDLVNELAESTEFRRATDGSVRPRRMADRECVLRFVAFYCQDLNSYNGNMDAFLARTMKSINSNMAESEKMEIRQAFSKSMRFARELFGSKAFRKPRARSGRRSVINKPLFECLSVVLAHVEESDQGTLIERKTSLANKLDDLMMNRDFHGSISIGTQTIAQIRRRFDCVKRIINEVINDERPLLA